MEQKLTVDVVFQNSVIIMYKHKYAPNAVFGYIMYKHSVDKDLDMGQT